MREPFFFTFNLKFPAQEPVQFFSKFVVSLPVLVPARTEHELTIWVILSTFSLQSLHTGDTSWWSTPFFIALVLCACSSAAHIRLSVSRFSSPAFSHCHLLWSCIASVSLRNWPCNAFFFHAACLSFSHSSLLLLLFYILLWYNYYYIVLYFISFIYYYYYFILDSRCKSVMFDIAVATCAFPFTLNC